jgi:hypothetical protein
MVPDSQDTRRNHHSRRMVEEIGTSAKEEDNDAPNGIIGGFIRSLSKSIPRLIKTITSSTIGGFPNAMPIKTVASTADRISTIFDIANIFGTQVSKHASTRAPDTKPLTIRERFHLHSKVLLKAVPAFVKTSLLGTVAFETYDYIQIYLPKRDNGIVTTSSNALIVGSCCGAIHASIYVTWDVLEARIHNFIRTSHQPHTYRLSGIYVSHIVAHGSLFCAYETTKYLLLSQRPHLTNDTLSKIDVIASISFAGATSAVATEYVSHYTSTFEEHGISKGLKLIGNMDRPNLRSMLPLMVPTALGFLAYEYSKDNTLSS